MANLPPCLPTTPPSHRFHQSLDNPPSVGAGGHVWAGRLGGEREAKETGIIPSRSRYLLCKSEFIISQEIINCWADKRHRSAPPRGPRQRELSGAGLTNYGSFGCAVHQHQSSEASLTLSFGFGGHPGSDHFPSASPSRCKGGQWGGVEGQLRGVPLGWSVAWRWGGRSGSPALGRQAL